MKRGMFYVFGIFVVIFLSLFISAETYYNNDSKFAIQKNLTWPPQNYSDGYYGAESNPTGNPIGGFVGYDRIISSSDADYYVNTVDEFLQAIGNVSSGEIIYINDDAVLDFTYYDEIEIPANITIASGRGRDYSSGALIKKDIEKYNGSLSVIYLFQAVGNNTRFTGLRFDGGDMDVNYEFHASVFGSGREDLNGTYYEIYPVSTAIFSSAYYLEVDNCEFYGWRYAGVGSKDGAINNYVHHNYIHHNVHRGLGYGVVIGASSNISFLVEANLFNHNRHSVASSYHNNSYEARYNIQLDEQTSHDLDRHGNVGYGGLYTILHHNSIYREVGGQLYDMVGIRAPPTIEDGSQIYNNWFQWNNLADIVFTLYENFSASSPPGADGTNVTIYNNLLNASGNQYSPEPVVVLDVDDTSVFVNESILFDATGSYYSNGSVRYIEWDFSDNTSMEYGGLVSHSFDSPGVYLVKCTVFGDTGLLNSSYVNITVLPENSDKNYLNFWMFENSYVDSEDYVKKVAMINDVIVWEENFSDNVSSWKYESIEIPESIFGSEEKVKIQLGALTTKDYVSPDYPSNHDSEFFELYFDQVSFLKGGVNLIKDSDFEVNSGDWYSVENTTSWTSERSFYRKRGGKYSYKISPRYRDNYTAGTLNLLSQDFYLSSVLNSVDINVTQEYNFSHLNILDSSLRLYMPFDYNFSMGNRSHDYTNNSNNGDLHGDIFWNNSGYVGGAISFDGVNDYMSVGRNLSSFDFVHGTGNFSISFWSNKNDISGLEGVVGISAGSGMRGFSLGFSSSSVRFFIFNGTVGEYFSDVYVGQVVPNVWQYWTVVGNGTSLKWYLNGELKKTVFYSYSFSQDSATRKLAIGDSEIGFNEFLDGSLDELMIFDRPLNSTEVASIYNNQFPRFFSSGEMLFQGQDFSNKDFVNISLANCAVGNEWYLQANIDDGEYRNFTDCSILNYPIVDGSQNLDLTIKFNSDSNLFYSPLVEGEVSLDSWKIQSVVSEGSTSSGGSTSGIKLFNLSNSKSLYLKKGQSLQVEINSSLYLFEIFEVSSDVVFLNYYNKSVEVRVNETIEINLNDDEYYDIEIKVKKINGDFVDLEFKEIHELIPAEKEEEREEESRVVDDYAKVKNIYYVLGGVLILIILFLIFFKLRKSNIYI